MSEKQTIPLIVAGQPPDEVTNGVSTDNAAGGDAVMLTTMGGTSTSSNYKSIEDDRKVLLPGDQLMTREEVPPCPTYVYIAYYTFMLLGPFILSYASSLYIDNWEEYLSGVAFSVIFVISLGWFIGAIFYNLCGMSSNYTRKIGHITSYVACSFYVFPILLAGGVGAWVESTRDTDDEQDGQPFDNNALDINAAYENIIFDVIWAGYQSQIFIFFMTQPLRRLANHVCGDTRSKRPLRWINCCENTMDAFERTEDRPNHLLWLNTQTFLYYIFLFAMSFWWNDLDSGVQVLIPTFITGFGDGLAEPVGVKFGRNCCGRDCTFKTHGCCTKYDYTRSVPGSSMVLLSGYIGVALAFSDYTLWQFVIAMIVVPPVGTIVEAKAPHTLDNPFIGLIVGVVATAILYIPV